jgi:adenosylhomocysteine nucleosidase
MPPPPSLPGRSARPRPDESRMAIVTALPEELAPLRKRASGLRSGRITSDRFFLGRLAGRDVVMTCTGVGRVRAERGARALLDAFPVGSLLGAGVAGGLSPGLDVGEILVGSEILEASGAVAAPDASWVEQALRAGAGSRRATLVTVDEVLWSRQSKAALWSRCSPTQPAAVDLESAAWARVAAERGLPYLIVRSVLDKAEEELPELLARCQDPQGGLRRAKLVARALLRPPVIPVLIALRARTRSCADRLAGFVEKLLSLEGTKNRAC